MPISLLLEKKPQWPHQSMALAVWAYLVVFGSLFAFTAYLYLLANASTALAISYAFVNPVIALALGVAVGGETVTSGEWLACSVILKDVLMILICKTKKTQA